MSYFCRFGNSLVQNLSSPLQVSLFKLSDRSSRFISTDMCFVISQVIKYMTHCRNWKQSLPNELNASAYAKAAQ